MMTLRRGDKGSFVLFLQERLNFHGFYTSQGGEFNVGTERTLKEFQVLWNLEVNGICGDVEWGCLLQNFGWSRGGHFERKRLPELLLERVEKEGDMSMECMGVLGEMLGYLGCEERPFGRNRGKEVLELVQGTCVTGERRLLGSEYKRHCGFSNLKYFPLWSVIGLSTIFAKYFEADDWSEAPFGDWFGTVDQLLIWGERHGVLRVGDLGNLRPCEIFVIGMVDVDYSVRGYDDGARPRGGHCGLVLWDCGDGTVQTVECNTANGVRVRRRKKSQFYGVINWEGALEGLGYE